MGGFMLDNDNDELISDINIKVIGVGGGGGNALNCMVTAGIKDVEYIAVNTDAAALRSSKATQKVQIGEKLTRGRGAGNKPDVGERSAQENKDEISAALKVQYILRVLIIGNVHAVFTEQHRCFLAHNGCINCAHSQNKIQICCRSSNNFIGSRKSAQLCSRCDQFQQRTKSLFRACYYLFSPAQNAGIAAFAEYFFCFFNIAVHFLILSFNANF